MGQNGNTTASPLEIHDEIAVQSFMSRTELLCEGDGQAV